MTESIENAIDKAKASYEVATTALGVDVLESDVFGKNMCKKQKVSPDAMMQLGFQVIINHILVFIIIISLLYSSVLLHMIMEI